MLRHTRMTTLWSVALLLIAFIIAPAAAQQSDPVAINVTFAEVTQGRGDNTALGLYFTVNDATGAAIEPGSARSAFIQLEDGTRVEAQVEEANAPLSVVLVLDASGSMGPAADTMRRAAISAVESLPEGTNFSILRFNRQVPTGTPFTTNRTAVINEIALYQPARPSDADAGTCLFDATFAAIDKAREVSLPARRLVMLFTDGRDELIAGGAIDPCSAKTLDEVVTRASDVANPVNVYSIGLTGGIPIAEAELRRISDTSNGQAVFGSLEQLPALFESIVNSIKNQRVARAQICVSRGQHTATLLVNAGNNSGALADSISFLANVECIPATPTPEINPEVNIENTVFDPVQDIVTLTLRAAGQDQIDRFVIQAIDRNGNTVASFEQNAPIDAPITFDVAGVPDTELEIIVRAIRRDGTTADETERNLRIPRPTATPTVTFTPTPSPTITPSPRPRSANIDGIEYNIDADEVMINLLYGERQEIGRIRVTIFDSNNTQVRLLEPPELSDQVIFRGRENGLQPGQRYNVRVQALDASNAVLNESTQEFTYTPIVTATPSATPTPTDTLTPTPIVISALIEAVTFDAEAQQFVLRMTYENVDLIDSIEIDILDANGLLVDTIVPPVENTVTYAPGTKLVGQQQYTFQIKAINADGRVVDRQARAVTDPRTLTPTPTNTETPSPSPTITPTPSATPVVVDLRINPPVEDLTTFTLNIEFFNNNPDATDRYQLALVSRSGSNILSEQTFQESGNHTRQVSMANIPTGEYEIELIAFDSAENQLARAEIAFRWTQPDPTATPAPPGLADRIRDNPVLGIIVGLIALILVGTLLWLFFSNRRDRAKRANTAASLPSQTGAFIIPQMPPKPDAPKSSQPSQPTSNPTTAPAPRMTSGGAALDEPTIRPGQIDSFSTNASMDVGEATGAAAAPTGYLIVTESKDPNMVGKTIPLAKSPFYIGRTGPRQNDINFDGDKNLSRAHAELHYERERWFLMDPSSQLGTTVNNGERISGRIPLDEGDVIRLGGTTVLTFTRKG